MRPLRPDLRRHRCQSSNGKRESYYKCNGAHSPSIYGREKGVRRKPSEATTWKHKCGRTSRRSFAILSRCSNSFTPGWNRTRRLRQIRKQVTRLEGLLSQKTTERNRVVGLYRRSRLTEADLDTQMDEINKEETALNEQLAELRGRIVGATPLLRPSVPPRRSWRNCGNGWTSRFPGR